MSFKDLLKQFSTDKRDDNEILNLLLEMFKAHKRCLKQTSQKESVFSPSIVDAYKVYIQGKVERLPENISVLDLATKLCLQEINIKKNQEKQGIQMAPNASRPLPGIPFAYTTAAKVMAAAAAPQIPKPPTSNLFVSPTTTITTTAASTPPTSIVSSITNPYMTGPSRPRGRPPGSKNSPLSSAMTMDQQAINSMLMYSNPAFMQTITQFTDPLSLNAFISEYIKLTSRAGNIANVIPTSLSSSKTSPLSAKVSQPQSSLNSGIQHSKSSKSEIHGTFLTTSTSTTGQKNISSTKTVTTSNYSTASLTVQKNVSTSNVISSSISSSSLPTVTTQKNVKFSNTVSSSISSTAANIMKTGSSTVITVGSGELTITPSISITPNKVPSSSAVSSSSSITPPMPKRPRTNSPAFTLTSSVVDLTGNTPKTSKPQTSKPPPKLPADLPRSLSITPTSSMYNLSSKVSPLNKPVLTVQSQNLMKQNKPKKKQATTNGQQHTFNKKTLSKQIPPSSSKLPKQSPMPFGGLGIGNMQLELYNQYNELLRAATQSTSTSYLSQFAKFVTAPQSIQSSAPSTKSKAPKSNAISTVTSTNNPRGLISVKALDSLQNPKPNSTQNPKLSSSKQSFVMPEISTKSGKGVGPYGTINQNIAHSPQKVVFPTSLGNMRASNTASPAPALQIR